MAQSLRLGLQAILQAAQITEPKSRGLPWQSRASLIKAVPGSTGKLISIQIFQHDQLPNQIKIRVICESHVFEGEVVNTGQRHGGRNSIEIVDLKYAGKCLNIGVDVNVKVTARGVPPVSTCSPYPVPIWEALEKLGTGTSHEIDVEVISSHHEIMPAILIKHIKDPTGGDDKTKVTLPTPDQSAE